MHLLDKDNKWPCGILLIDSYLSYRLKLPTKYRYYKKKVLIVAFHNFKLNIQKINEFLSAYLDILLHNIY